MAEAETGKKQLPAALRKRLAARGILKVWKSALAHLSEQVAKQQYDMFTSLQIWPKAVVMPTAPNEANGSQ